MEREVRTESLRSRHRKEWRHDEPFQGQHNPGLALRTYRAIDWTHRARMEHGDSFSAFLFYWIAFNALYGAVPKDDDENGWEGRRRFFVRLIDVDGSDQVLKCLRVLKEPASRLVANELTYNVPVGWHELKLRGTRLKTRIARGETLDALVIVFSRLNGIRNWLVHGGIAWRSRIMDGAVVEGTGILTRLVPTFIKVMLAPVSVATEWDMPPLTPDRYEVRTSVKEIPTLET